MTGSIDKLAAGGDQMPTTNGGNFIASIIVLGGLSFSTSPSWSRSVGEKIGVDGMLDRAPTGAGVLLDLHQFNLFQHSVTASSDKRGDDVLKKFAVFQLDAAAKRDKALVALTGKAGLKIEYPDDPSLTRANTPGGLDGWSLMSTCMDFTKPRSRNI